jgi:hypothetical protein
MLRRPAGSPNLQTVLQKRATLTSQPTLLHFAQSRHRLRRRGLPGSLTGAPRACSITEERPGRRWSSRGMVRDSHVSQLSAAVWTATRTRQPRRRPESRARQLRAGYQHPRRCVSELRRSRGTLHICFAVSSSFASAPAMLAVSTASLRCGRDHSRGRPPQHAQAR